jgi:hypothetical protein
MPPPITTTSTRSGSLSSLAIRSSLGDMLNPSCRLPEAAVASAKRRRMDWIFLSSPKRRRRLGRVEPRHGGVAAYAGQDRLIGRFYFGRRGVRQSIG